MSEKMLISLKRDCDCDARIKPPSFRWEEPVGDTGKLTGQFRFYIVELPFCQKCKKEFVEVVKQ